MAKKILIVEDDPILSRAYKTILEKEGYNVTHVSDGSVGVEKTEKEKYDLILLDVLMPNVGGIEFLHIFKPKEHPETKVIVFSNMSEPDAMKKAMDLGAHKYLTKATFSPKEMVKLVKDTLEGK